MSPRKKPSEQVSPDETTGEVDTTEAPAPEEAPAEQTEPCKCIERLVCTQYPELNAFTPYGKARFHAGVFEPEEDEESQAMAKHLLDTVPEIQEED